MEFTYTSLSMHKQLFIYVKKGAIISVILLLLKLIYPIKLTKNGTRINNKPAQSHRFIVYKPSNILTYECCLRFCALMPCLYPFSVCKQFIDVFIDVTFFLTQNKFVLCVNFTTTWKQGNVKCVFTKVRPLPQNTLFKPMRFIKGLQGQGNSRETLRKIHFTSRVALLVIFTSAYLTGEISHIFFFIFFLSFTYIFLAIAFFNYQIYCNIYS